MTIALTSADQSALDNLKANLLAATPKKLEELGAALLGRLIGLPIAVAQAGYQHGGDAGPAGAQGRRFRVEAKRYADTSLNERELLGEIDQALARDPALEAWILVATRTIPEQVEQSLSQHGEECGVPVVFLGWEDVGLPQLAALCATYPDIVAQIISQAAANHARVLADVAEPVVEQLDRNLQSWALGFDRLRQRSHEQLVVLWERPKIAVAELGQNAAGGAVDRKIRRASVHTALSAWWDGRATEDAPAILHGFGGVGKTWAGLDWLVDQRETLPIVLVVPASAATGMKQPSGVALKLFIAERLYGLTEVRSTQHWLQRVDRLLQRPEEEGPVFTVMLDGINQEAGVGWLSILKTLQAPPFEHRVRVVASTRPLHLDNALANLNGLVVQPEKISVDPYDLADGGEFDQMLAYEGLTRSDLHTDLVELARIPRLFSLVVKLRDRLNDAGQVTVHRLLWEYGRDTLGVRAGHSFSEQEWRDWLATIAGAYKDGVRDFSVSALGQTAARPDLTAGEVAARLSDIVDGRFATKTPGGRLKLVPQVVSHALALALLNHLSELAPTTIEVAAVALHEWADPIAGLDEKVEILRAAVSIVVAQEAPTDTPVAGALVTSWLQSQNLPDAHRVEVEHLAPTITVPLLEVIERSLGQAQTSARLCAIDAIRSFNGSNPAALAVIVERLAQWVAVVSRGENAFHDREESIVKQRREFFETRLGADRSGRFRVLGVDLELVELSDETLAEAAATLLQGAPLASAMPVFEACAARRTVERGDTIWRAFCWLCDLNEVDRAETFAGLRTLSLDMRARRPEPGVHPDLPARAAAVLLWLAGEEQDEVEAADLNPPLFRHFSYEEYYLADPARAGYPLERRHAEQVLLNTASSIRSRVERSGDLWLDPSFSPPAAFVAELATHAAQIDVTVLDRHGSDTVEDHNFEKLEPALARCVPHELARLMRAKLRALADVPPESRYWAAIRAPSHLLLADNEEAEAARTLRLAPGSQEEPDSGNAKFESSQLLAVEMKDQDGLTQATTVLEADRGFVPIDFEWLLKPLSADEADVLIDKFGAGTDKQQSDLLALLSYQASTLGEKAWNWGVSLMTSDADHLRGLAYRVLCQADAGRLGSHLLSTGWSWGDPDNLYVDHYGSHALVEATLGLPFEQVLPRIAPWRLMWAVLRRGDEPGEARLAAGVLDHILMDSGYAPDLGSIVTVDREARRNHPFYYNVEPAKEETGNPVEDLCAAFDAEQQRTRFQRAVETAAERIEAARKSGARLYLTDLDPEDLAAVLRHAPEFVEVWLEGQDRPTEDFVRRVQLAEPAYLALCEALLAADAPRGVALWRALKRAISVNFVGQGGVDDTIQILFRAPQSAEVDALLLELFDLEKCNTDAALESLALAAAINDRSEWLEDRITADEQSGVTWRKHRAITLRGFITGGGWPNPEAWPEGKLSTTLARIRKESARRRLIDAAARHWWRTYLSAETAEEAYSAWILFLNAAGPTSIVWRRSEADATDEGVPLFRKKIAQAQLNVSDLKRRVKKRSERLDGQFIGHKITDALWPWRETSAS